MIECFEDSTVRHGTPSGWALHQKLGERPCDPCYQAKSEYDQRRRSAPEEAKKNRLHARAQSKANTDLRKRHPEEYRELYQAHLAALKAEAAQMDKES